MMVIV
jgi:hypothetical protein